MVNSEADQSGEVDQRSNRVTKDGSDKAGQLF